MHNFILANLDTDAISIGKPNGEEFTKEERDKLLTELNDLLPEYVNFTDDGYFKKFIVLKAKNYIMYDGVKVKYKGSSLKSSTLELGLQSFLKEIIDCLIFDKQEDIVPIYNMYLLELGNVQDIKRWASKKTLSETMYNSERKNETQVIDAIAGKEYSKGDKVWCYFDENDVLRTIDDFQPGCYSKKRFYQKLYKTALRFETVLDKSIFINYSLVKNYKRLHP